MSYILLAVACLIIVLPFVCFRRAISLRARRSNVDPTRYHLFAATGWLVGFAIGFVVIMLAYLGLWPNRVVGLGWGLSTWVVGCGLLVCGVSGAAVGPGLSYLLLWMRMARGPDY